MRPVFQIAVTARTLRDPIQRDAAVARYEKARAALKLQLINPDGGVIPDVVLHIVDPPLDEQAGSLVLEVQFTSAAP